MPDTKGQKRIITHKYTRDSVACSPKVKPNTPRPSTPIPTKVTAPKSQQPATSAPVKKD